MFIFVILSLFSAWIWVDATEQISMGLEFTPFMLFEDYPLRIDIVFTDLDLDGDEDMLLRDPSTTQSLDAFENVNIITGRRWQQNPDLINGIPSDIGVSSIGKGDLNDDGRDEIVVTPYYPDPSYAFVNTGEVGSPYWENDLTLMDTLRVWEPDFADIDGDGDQDMVVTYGYLTENDYFIGPLLYWNCGNPQHPEWVKDTTYFWNDEWEEPIEGEQPSWIDWGNDGVWDLLVIQEQMIMDVPPPEPGSINLSLNEGTANSPLWNPRGIYDDYTLGCVTLLDWNQDGIEDFLIQGNEYDGGYRYYPGERDVDGDYQEFEHNPCYTWGGIMGQYPAASDVTDDEIPELTITEHEHHMALDFWGGYMWHYYYPHYRYYSSANQEGNLWREDKHQGYGGLYLTDEVGFDAKAHFQYVDFGNDHLIDCVVNDVVKPNWESDYTGTHTLYRNQGTRQEPDWIKDSTALEDIPLLFPSCFLDIDGDGDKDVIGYSIVDSTIRGFLNVRSDKDPNYMEYESLVSGLEGINPTYFTAGDITDNDLDLPDLVVGVSEGNLTAFFNTGQTNPRWHKHEEVFKGLGVNGNPCLCDADADGDLDLYLVTGGRLHFYRNESTGGIEETADRASIATIYVGREVEIRLSSPLIERARLSLYNVAGQKVKQYLQTPQGNQVRFRISDRPGVYFYRVVVGGDDFSGKIVIF